MMAGFGGSTGREDGGLPPVCSPEGSPKGVIAESTPDAATGPVGAVLPSMADRWAAIRQAEFAPTDPEPQTESVPPASGLPYAGRMSRVPDWKRILVERELRWRRQPALRDIIASRRADGMSSQAIADYLSDRLSDDHFRITISRQNLENWATIDPARSGDPDPLYHHGA